MKRSALTRRTPLKRGKSLRRVSARRAERIEQWVDDDVHARIVARDRDCVAPRRGHALACAGRRHVHHVQFKSRGGDDSDDNLVLLCAAHHEWVHAHSKLAESFDLARPAAPPRR